MMSTFEEKPEVALRIMLRMSGFTEDEIDAEALLKAREIWDEQASVDIESQDWPDSVI